MAFLFSIVSPQISLLLSYCRPGASDLVLNNSVEDHMGAGDVMLWS